MNGNGQNLRFVIAAALALASATTGAKTTGNNASVVGEQLKHSRVIVGGDAIVGGDRSKIRRTDVIVGGDRSTARSPGVITGGDAIVGGDRSKIRRTDVIVGGDRATVKRADVIVGGDIQAPKNALLVGPIDAVDQLAGTVSALGRTFKASPDKVSVIANKIGSGGLPMVAVLGAAKNDGTLAPKSMVLLNASYVPGATKVLLKGNVTSVDRASGKLSIGKQLVDYSSVLSSADVAISVGTIVTVVGTQPLSQGLILADAIR